jgi:hypothetical protein
MNTNTGGPAFPSHGSMGEVAHEGMTLRDYFAAKALQCYMVNEVWNPDTYKRAASSAYEVAAAMLKAREA